MFYPFCWCNLEKIDTFVSHVVFYLTMECTPRGHHSWSLEAFESFKCFFGGTLEGPPPWSRIISHPPSLPIITHKPFKYIYSAFHAIIINLKFLVLSTRVRHVPHFQTTSLRKVWWWGMFFTLIKQVQQHSDCSTRVRHVPHF